jgi:hypothetical protein
MSDVYCVVLQHEALNAIANDCGLVVDPNHRAITQSEIEYFGGCVARECILTILAQKPEDGSTAIHNQLARALADKFGVSM